ncbi:hypothetical protein [Serratia sp. Tan611]|uniref:hypothetical protein n=1 Tax=Serratia sp. Tan611 TaxID=2773264 RepID=UPI001931D7B8|nr:hypothetical protein [Serratia sp. Tan611]CAE1147791.1 conserved protein of unknown function [Serratia sp. Tan611]
MSGNSLTNGVDITPTPSQYLFSIWNGLCGNTVVCSGVTLAARQGFSEETFLSAWRSWFRTSYELNINVGYHSGRDEPLTLTLDERDTDESCFRYIENSNTSMSDVVADEMRTLLNTQMNIGEKHSHNLLVIRFENGEFAILLAVEHMFADGLGVDVLLNRYLALIDSPDDSPISAKERYFEDKIHLDKYADYQEYDGEFVRSYAKDVLAKRFFWDPEGRALAHRKGNYATLQKRISFSALKNINHYLTAHKISLFSYLTGTFVESFFASQPLQSELLLQIPTHGRKYNQNSLDKHVVGCFAQAFLLHARRDEHEALPAEQRFSRLQRYVLDCMGSEIDQLTARRNAASIKKSAVQSKLTDDAYALSLRKSMPTNIYFSFYGASSLPIQHTSFDIDRYYLATTNLAGALDVMAIQYGECLEISFNYDALFFQEQTIAGLAECYERLLLDAVAPSVGLVDETTRAPKSDNRNNTLLIDIINKYSLETISAQDLDSHLEIDLGLDSLLKTRILSEFMARGTYGEQDINREHFYSAATLAELLDTVIPENGHIRQ